jgi:hypothetical protein
VKLVVAMQTIKRPSTPVDAANALSFLVSEDAGFITGQIVHPLDPTRLHSAAGDGYFESVDDGDSWRRIVDGLKHQYCWSVAVSFDDPKTFLLSASNSAYGAHYKESANSVVYRRTGNDAWRLLRDGLYPEASQEEAAIGTDTKAAHPPSSCVSALD